MPLKALPSPTHPSRALISDPNRDRNPNPRAKPITLSPPLPLPLDQASCNTSGRARAATRRCAPGTGSCGGADRTSWSSSTSSMSRIAPSRIAPFDPFWMLKKKKKKKKKKRSFAARRMAAALAAHAAVVQGPSGREAGAFSTSQRARARGQPKEQSGVALRRSAQAALEASSRPVEASRGQSRPLRPPYPHAGSIRGPPDQDGDAISTRLLGCRFYWSANWRAIST